MSVTTRVFAMEKRIGQRRPLGALTDDELRDAIEAVRRIVEAQHAGHPHEPLPVYLKAVLCH